MEDFIARLKENSFLECKDWDLVQEKLKNIHQKGLNQLHIISDFDMTLTKYWDNGKRSASSHAILTRSDRLGPHFKKRSEELYQKYYPIEVSKTVPYEEKVKAMVEWWSHAHETILEAKLSKHDLNVMVKETPVTFRAHLKEFIESCSQTKIPLLVFSAGLTDVIREILVQAKLWHSNMHVISNKMNFNEAGICIGFEDPLIHVFNKNEASISSKSYHGTIENRKNVVLLGDSLGDLRMSEGLSHDIELTIGFLNHDKESFLPNYLEAFDIVITEDSSLEWITEWLKLMR